MGLSVVVIALSPKTLTLFLVDAPTLMLQSRQWKASFSASAVIFNTATSKEIKYVNCVKYIKLLLFEKITRKLNK